MRLLLVALAALLYRLDCAGAVQRDELASRCDLSACPCYRFPVGCVKDRYQCCSVCAPCDGDPGDGLHYLSSGGAAGPGPCRREDDACGRDGQMPTGA